MECLHLSIGRTNYENWALEPSTYNPALSDIYTKNKLGVFKPPRRLLVDIWNNNKEHNNVRLADSIMMLASNESTEIRINCNFDESWSTSADCMGQFLRSWLYPKFDHECPFPNSQRSVHVFFEYSDPTDSYRYSPWINLESNSISFFSHMLQWATLPPTWISKPSSNFHRQSGVSDAVNVGQLARRLPIQLVLHLKTSLGGDTTGASEDHILPVQSVIPGCTVSHRSVNAFLRVMLGESKISMEWENKDKYHK